MDKTKRLSLSEQLCFPIYAASRMITRSYQSLLDKLDLTYPQYLVMLVLWEDNNVAIGHIGEKLYLNTNTLTPLIKKLVDKKLVTKTRSDSDERTVHVALTPQGENLKNKASDIPETLFNAFQLPVEELVKMRELMWEFLKGFELK